MIEAAHAWYHRAILKHAQRRIHVSVPLFDFEARGLLILCECKKEWAL